VKCGVDELKKHAIFFEQSCIYAAYPYQMASCPCTSTEEVTMVICAEADATFGLPAYIKRKSYQSAGQQQAAENIALQNRSIQNSRPVEDAYAWFGDTYPESMLARINKHLRLPNYPMVDLPPSVIEEQEIKVDRGGDVLCTAVHSRKTEIAHTEKTKSIEESTRSNRNHGFVSSGV
jgi:hypothetical protein